MSQLPRLPNPRAAIEGLLLDELQSTLESTRGVLAGNPEESALRALDRLGVQSEVEAGLAAELAARAPLAVPGRFSEAHRLAMQALEVLDREGARNPRIPRIGPLRPLAAMAVRFVAAFIIGRYVSAITGRLWALYARREAQSLPGSESRSLLRAARVESERMMRAFGGGPSAALGLVGGGVVGGLFASMTPLLGKLTNQTVLGVTLLVMIVLFFSLSWVMLRGAALARHRSRLIMGPPLAALWETIGAAGGPPEDDSSMIATIAIICAAGAWIVLPIAATVVFLV